MKSLCYIDNVMRKVGLLPKQLKRRIRTDLENSIALRVERGESMRNIEADMGTPAEMAAEIVAGFRPEFDSRTSILRYAYILLAFIPTAYIILTIIHIFITPMPSGFNSASDLFRDLFTTHLSMTVRLIINYMLFLTICAFGYTIFSLQLYFKKNSIVIITCLTMLIGIALLPSIYGIDTMQMIYSFLGITISNRNLLFTNIIQPQTLIIAFTVAYYIFLERVR